jgi:3-deoxy-D-manno-octulosonic-acid transferase
MIFLLYDSLLVLALLLLAPLSPLLLLLPRWRQGLTERLGWLPAEVRRQASMAEGSLWVHAASLGEVNAVAPVLRELQGRLPRQALVFTCTTVAGREQARRLFPQALACLLLPVDLPWLLRPWLRRFRPKLALVAETELWPNFLGQLKAHGCRVLLVNGRITARSAGRYRRLGSAMAEILDTIDVFGVQSQEDADRFEALGARRSRLVVTGNTKFDLGLELQQSREQSAALRQAWGLSKQAPVIVAGSTRPGEEGPLLDAYKVLKKAVPELRLVLAPRHLQRGAEVEAALKAANVAFGKRSAGGPTKDQAVLLLDTLGELKAFYGLAEPAGLAWIGGSFKDFGGQNPLEAAALGVPVLFGPYMKHFPDVAAALLQSGGALQVPADELAEASLGLLRQPKARAAAAEAAAACVAERAGASRRSADLAWKLLLVSTLKQAGRHRGQDQYNDRDRGLDDDHTLA